MTPTSACRYALSVSLALAASLSGEVAAATGPVPVSLRDAVASLTTAQAEALGSEEGLPIAVAAPRARRILVRIFQPPCTVGFGPGSTWDRTAFSVRAPAPVTVYGPLSWDCVRLRARATVGYFTVAKNKYVSTTAVQPFAGPVARFNSPRWEGGTVSVGAALLLNNTEGWRRLAMELPFRQGDPWALTAAQRWRLFQERGAVHGDRRRIGYREMTAAQQQAVRSTLMDAVQYELKHPRGTELPELPRPVDAPTATITDMSVEFDVYLPDHGWLRLGEGTAGPPVLTRTYAPTMTANF